MPSALAAAGAPAAPPSSATAAPAAPQRFDIDEYRVEGADLLPQIEVEEAVYPFLGPKRTADDVEKARAALEKAYHDKGYQTVSVAIPPQNPLNGFVVLKVTEAKVGRLRVKGSRFFSLEKIKAGAPSLSEGKVPNFNAVTKDIVGLNQWPDRKVTPALRAGVTPGTVDVDLTVEDKPPLHGSLELNNRQSPNTSALRTTATVHYDNFWQLGHSGTFTFQTAPTHPDDVKALSGSYLARMPGNDSVSLLVYGVKSKSNVAVIGDINVIGPGEILGSRLVLTLPNEENFFHSISFGIDYKHFNQTTQQGASGFSTPVTYYPVTVNYSGSWQGEGSLTQLNAGITAGLRGIGSGFEDFDAKRFKATSSFAYFRGDLARSQDLPSGFQLYGKVQGQLADQPLISSEQFSAGGIETVRGYFESEVIGDNGALGTVELRSFNIPAWLRETFKPQRDDLPSLNFMNEWRFYGFVDGGVVTIYQPLPEQQSNFNVASYGVGTRFKMHDHLNGVVNLGVPLITQANSRAYQPRVNFRVWGEF